MSDILSKLREVHSARARTHVHVAEYGIDLYFPPLTIAARERCRRGVNPKDEHALYVNTVIELAETEDGEKVFSHTPKVVKELYQMEFATLMSIVLRAGGDNLSAEMVAQIEAVDPLIVRDVLAEAAGEAEDLANAIRNAPDSAVASALRVLAEGGQGAETVKNG